MAFYWLSVFVSGFGFAKPLCLYTYHPQASYPHVHTATAQQNQVHCFASSPTSDGPGDESEWSQFLLKRLTPQNAQELEVRVRMSALQHDGHWVKLREPEHGHETKSNR